MGLDTRWNITYGAVGVGIVVGTVPALASQHLTYVDGRVRKG